MSRIAKLVIVGGVLVGGIVAVPMAYAATTPEPNGGFVKICEVGATKAVTGSFTFTVSGVKGTTTVAVGTCSKPISVVDVTRPVTVTQVARTGFVLNSVKTTPVGRLVSANLTTGKAAVKVPSGSVASATTVTFTNKVK